MTESDKILTAEYLDWHAKLTGLGLGLGFTKVISFVNKSGEKF